MDMPWPVLGDFDSPLSPADKHGGLLATAKHHILRTS